MEKKDKKVKLVPVESKPVKKSNKNNSTIVSLGTTIRSDK